MRRLPCLLLATTAVFGLKATTSVVHAATVVQTVPIIQTIGDFTPFDIDTLPFNTSLGTLQSVIVEISGSYIASIAADLQPGQSPPSTATLSTRLFVEPSNDASVAQSVNLGSQTVVIPAPLPGSAAIETGLPTTVDQSFTFTTIADYETSGSLPQDLTQFGFRTGSTFPGTSGSDLTSFAGDATVTYVYDVPEPATLVILGTAVLGLTAVRRRRA